jgi:hypothetical protein
VKHLLLIAVASMALAVLSQPSFAETNQITFNLAINPAIANCLSVPGWPAPTAQVTVIRGFQNDTLQLHVHHVKPNLGFDMFTVEHSNLLSDGSVDPHFVNFGMAWYQSDVQAGPLGNAETQIKTILLDQIFGFDAATALPPTNTFHVGFWFNNPHDAAACGFDVTHPTPFNGEHKAGPVAMISVPNAQTGLGPLCTSPKSGGGCNP